MSNSTNSNGNQGNTSKSSSTGGADSSRGHDAHKGGSSTGGGSTNGLEAGTSKTKGGQGTDTDTKGHTKGSAGGK